MHFGKLDILLASFLAGVTLLTYPETIYPILFILIVCSLAIGIVLLFRKRKSVGLKVLAASVGGMISIIFVYVAVLPIKQFPTGQVPFSGVVTESPVISGDRTRIVVSTEEGKLLLTTKEKSVRYGDYVEGVANTRQPEAFETDFGKTFAYDEYLYNQGIYRIGTISTLTVLGNDPPSRLLARLYSFKERLLGIVRENLPTREANLVGGIVLGEKQSFDASLRQALSITGTSHIVALSGYNVSLVVAMFWLLLQGLGKRVAALGSIVAIILFVLATGVQITAVRAGIMGSLILLATLVGREYMFLRALLLTAVGMVITNPRLLVYDLSFELSFLATIGVVLLSPKLTFVRLPLRWIEDVTKVTLAASIMVVPLIAYKIGVFSLVSFPVNIIIAPLVPLVMFLAIPLFFFGLIGKVIVLPFAFLAATISSGLLKIIEFAATIPYAALPVTIPFWTTALYYLALFAFLVGHKTAKIDSGLLPQAVEAEKDK